MPPRLRERARVVAAAAIAAAGVSLVVGPLLLLALGRPIAFIADLYSPHLVTRAMPVAAHGSSRLEVRAVTTSPIAMGGQRHLPPLTPLGPFDLSLAHAIVPVALLGAVLLGWPAAARRERLLRAAAWLPAAAVLLLLVVPLHVAGLVDMQVEGTRLAAGEPPNRLWTIEAMVFLESGGRLLLAVMLAVLCIAALKPRSRSGPARLAERPVDAKLVDAAREARRRHEAGIGAGRAPV
jgi:hypothetical protein